MQDLKRALFKLGGYAFGLFIWASLFKSPNLGFFLGIVILFLIRSKNHHK